MFEKMKNLLNEMEEWNDQCEYWSLYSIEEKDQIILIKLEVDQYYQSAYKGPSNEIIIKCPKDAFNDEKIFTILYNIIDKFGTSNGEFEEPGSIVKSNKTLLDNNNIDIIFKENAEGIGSRMIHRMIRQHKPKKA